MRWGILPGAADADREVGVLVVALTGLRGKVAAEAKANAVVISARGVYAWPLHAVLVHRATHLTVAVAVHVPQLFEHLLMQPRRGHITRGIGALHIAIGHTVAPQHKRTLHLKAEVVCVALRGAYFSDADLEASHLGRVVGRQLRVGAHDWCC